MPGVAWLPLNPKGRVRFPCNQFIHFSGERRLYVASKLPKKQKQKTQLAEGVTCLAALVQSHSQKKLTYKDRRANEMSIVK